MPRMTLEELDREIRRADGRRDGGWSVYLGKVAAGLRSAFADRSFALWWGLFAAASVLLAADAAQRDFNSNHLVFAVWLVLLDSVFPLHGLRTGGGQEQEVEVKPLHTMLAVSTLAAVWRFRNVLSVADGGVWFSMGLMSLLLAGVYVIRAGASRLAAGGVEGRFRRIKVALRFLPSVWFLLLYAAEAPFSPLWSILSSFLLLLGVVPLEKAYAASAPGVGTLRAVHESTAEDPAEADAGAAPAPGTKGGSGTGDETGSAAETERERLLKRRRELVEARCRTLLEEARRERAAGRVRGALELLNSLLMLDDTDKEAVLEYASLLGELGRSTEAVRVLASFMRSHPSDAEVLEAMAVVLLRDGNTAAALKVLRRAVDREPGRVCLYVRLVRTCLEAGRMQEARQWALRGLEVEPGHVWLSRVHCNLSGRFHGAAEEGRLLHASRALASGDPDSFFCSCVEAFCDSPAERMLSRAVRAGILHPREEDDEAYATAALREALGRPLAVNGLAPTVGMLAEWCRRGEAARALLDAWSRWESGLLDVSSVRKLGELMALFSVSGAAVDGLNPAMAVRTLEQEASRAVSGGTADLAGALAWGYCLYFMWTFGGMEKDRMLDALASFIDGARRRLFTQSASQRSAFFELSALLEATSGRPSRAVNEAERALKHCETAEGFFPVLVLPLLAARRLSAGDAASALSLAREAVRIYPSDYGAWRIWYAAASSLPSRQVLEAMLRESSVMLVEEDAYRPFLELRYSLLKIILASRRGARVGDAVLQRLEVLLRYSNSDPWLRLLLADVCRRESSFRDRSCLDFVGRWNRREGWAAGSVLEPLVRHTVEAALESVAAGGSPAAVRYEALEALHISRACGTAALLSRLAAVALGESASGAGPSCIDAMRESSVVFVPAEAVGEDLAGARRRIRGAIS